MKKIFKIVFYLYLINIIYSEYIWKISFSDEEDNSNNKSNILNIKKGNYKTIKVSLNYAKNDSENITHINTTLYLNHSEVKMIPSELNINTEKSNIYYVELGIPCDTESNSTEINFELEDNTFKDLIEIDKCIVNFTFIPTILNFSVFNADNFTNNIFSKIYIKQDFKNFEKLEFEFESSCVILQNIMQKIDNIIINEYNYEDLFLIYSSIVKPTLKPRRKIGDFGVNCSIEINKLTDNKCFLIDQTLLIHYDNKTLDIGSKNAFYHNSLASSYIDSDNNSELNTSVLNLYFYNEMFYFASYCVIQDINNDFLSDYEILNQRANFSNKNIVSSFYMNAFDKDINESIITFEKLEKDLNYKVKCIFDFFDDKIITLTYGEGMLIPIKINFNETKSNLKKNCYLSNDLELDTRYCDVMNDKLVFKVFYDLGHSYRLNYFNFTDLELFNSKNTEEKIIHIKNIIDGNTNIGGSENELISTLSDYLFVINCYEDKTCIEGKNMIFKNLLIKYIGKYDKLDSDNEQNTLNDILLFNNIIENTDCINYDNFDYMVNNVFSNRNYFYSNSTKKYNQYLTNYFLLIYDRFISIITKHKTLYKDKFEIDKELKIYKSQVLIDFYNYFIRWISHGLINGEDRFINLCQNIIANYVETPVSSKISTIIDTKTVKITGFDTEQSEKLYKTIYSAGAISYKKFPLFPLDNKNSEVVTFFLFTDLRDNFENEEINYSEAFKIIFKEKSTGNYCYLWNNDYKKSKNKLVNNFIATEYLDKDSNDKYDINCISRIMISPMTVILGQKDLKGSLFEEGISFLSVIVIIFITLCLIMISLPFILSKFYKKQTDRAQSSVSELNSNEN